MWTPKELVSNIMEIMKRKHFFYIENMEVINLDRKKAIEIYAPNLQKGEIIKKSQTSMLDLD